MFLLLFHNHINEPPRIPRICVNTPDGRQPVIARDRNEDILALPYTKLFNRLSVCCDDEDIQGDHIIPFCGASQLKSDWVQA